MQDGMKQQDQVGVGLSCGHPNVEQGQKCPLCGQVVQNSPPQETKDGS